MLFPLLAGALCAACAASASPARAAAPGRLPTVARVPTGAITGRVLDRGGAPVAGAVVRVLTGRDDADSAAAGQAGTQTATQTDGAGGFVLRGVRAGAVRPGTSGAVVVVLDPAAVTLAGLTVRPTYFPAVAAPATPVSTAGFSTEELRRAHRSPVRGRRARGAEHQPLRRAG